MGSGECLHEIFEAQAARFPHRVAVSSSGRRVTYRELNARADAIAASLRTARVQPEDLVGLCAGRGPDLVAGMLGILKAGAAYLPIDPDYPEERIRLLLADSGTRLVVADTAGLIRVRDHVPDTLDLDTPAGNPPGTDYPGPASRPGTGGAVAGRDHHLAYVIYTSGSTGRPKGVEVEHRCVVRLFTSTAAWFGFDESDVWALFHSPSFDFSVWEIWGALLHGGRLVVVPPAAARAPLELWRLLRAEGVTVLNQTPSAFRLLLAAGASLPPRDRLPLRTVIFGGERLDVGMLRPWIDRHGTARPRLVNMYGITETTVHVSYRRITEADLADPASSPIGTHLPDLRITVHGPDGEPVADGTPGEMWVSGAGLARGYRHRPDLTAERFVTTHDGRRVYRSGDLAVRVPARHRGAEAAATGTSEGTELLYLGRADDQLKVRGYRIEPFEVEVCLATHPDVAAAVVDGVDGGDGDLRLVAFVQLAPGAAGDVDHARVLREHAQDRLPAHLRPSEFRFVAGIPLTPQGKADRRAFRLRETVAATKPST